jgi:exosortase family protein XrtF
MSMWKEFKPAFSFLAKFLGIYVVGNLLYGVYVESHGQKADRLTVAVTEQTAAVLQWAGNDVHTEISTDSPKVFLKTSADTILNVFEGCNGVNVMIIFVAFVFAFGGPVKKMTWFIPSGLIIIHLSNLLRISLLYYVSQYYQRYFYYIHKYFFTAVLYMIVVILWSVWVFKFNEVRKKSSAS